MKREDDVAEATEATQTSGAARAQVQALGTTRVQAPGAARVSEAAQASGTPLAPASGTAHVPAYRASREQASGTAPASGTSHAPASGTAPVQASGTDPASRVPQTRVRKASRAPIIGIVPSFLPESNALSVRQHYTDAIVAAGGAPLMLPLTRDTSVYERLFPQMDGFLLTGGQDINPARYGEQAASDKLSELTPTREEVECLILAYANQFDMPVLGICRGMQMINVFFGGTLYADLADQFNAGEHSFARSVGHWQKEPYEKPTHFVDIVRASKLHEILGADRIPTNSMHHQGICKLAPQLNATAYGPDGLVEAVEVRGRTFIMGVQWHPEFFSKEKQMGCMFSSLVNEARAAADRARVAVAEVPCRMRTCFQASACDHADSLRRHQHAAPRPQLRIERQDDDELWPSITFADCI